MLITNRITTFVNKLPTQQAFQRNKGHPNTMATFQISQWMPSDPLKRVMDAVPSHDEMWMALANAGIPVSEIPKCIEKEEWIELTTFKWEEKTPEPTIWHWGTNPQDGSSVAKAREWHKTCVDDNVVFITASTEEWYKKEKPNQKKMGRVDQIEKFKLEAQEGDLIYLHSAANGGVTHWGEYTGEVSTLDEENIGQLHKIGVKPDASTHLVTVKTWVPFPKPFRGKGFRKTLYKADYEMPEKYTLSRTSSVDSSTSFVTVNLEEAEGYSPSINGVEDCEITLSPCSSEAPRVSEEAFNKARVALKNIIEKPFISALDIAPHHLLTRKIPVEQTDSESESDTYRMADGTRYWYTSSDSDSDSPLVLP